MTHEKGDHWLPDCGCLWVIETANKGDSCITFYNIGQNCSQYLGDASMS